MKEKITKLFNSELGQKIYESFKRALSDFSMHEKIKSGVLIGFSGGPDSVMLLSLLYKYSIEEISQFKILAVHINHNIRGEEAKRDEVFSKEFCEALGIEYISKMIDVPHMSKSLSLSVEEAARKARYSTFKDIIESRNDISTIAVAHNSSDNIETVIFNMLRGSGTKGLSGINPARDNLIRPLIYVSKKYILEALDYHDIPYVIDSTNLLTDYTRNYIRHNLIPHFSKIIKNPEASIERMCQILRMDDDFIESEAKKFISDNLKEKSVALNKLKNLHPALLSRVLSLLAKEHGIPSLESIHISKVRELIFSSSNDFSVSIPGGVSFIAREGFLTVGILQKASAASYEIKLSLGVNFIPEINKFVLVSEKPFDKTFTNVYKIAIQQCIESDIIVGELFVREKRDGDAYRYGGMTHKLKKIFNDRGISPARRFEIPVICDDYGILWVPGFSVRDGGSIEKCDKKFYVALADKFGEDKI